MKNALPQIYLFIFYIAANSDEADLLDLEMRMISVICSSSNTKVKAMSHLITGVMENKTIWHQRT